MHSPNPHIAQFIENGDPAQTLGKYGDPQALYRLYSQMYREQRRANAELLRDCDALRRRNSNQHTEKQLLGGILGTIVFAEAAIIVALLF